LRRRLHGVRRLRRLVRLRSVLQSVFL
jgi:hypothetical protein